ncbi:hypothetical protein [Aliikangiella maris]|uniref:Transglutaminase-like domain-containing protein n=2 Tax=Aliikangiella maris TaxID=3162458 RepID=A0ABV3MV56_9GAMM
MSKCKVSFMFEFLPNSDLLENGELSQKFKEFGLSSFHDACDYVWKLPYGRTSDRCNWNLVLTEGKGACSTKHALLKALANELGIDVDLVVGIYAMTGKNTPGVGEVLNTHGLDYIPEAHCYLMSNGIRVDLTRHGIETEEDICEFMLEQSIEPNGIGDEKQDLHKEFIKHEFGESEFDKVWAVRERCISAISI